MYVMQLFCSRGKINEKGDRTRITLIKQICTDFKSKLNAVCIQELKKYLKHINTVISLLLQIFILRSRLKKSVVIRSISVIRVLSLCNLRHA